MLCARCGAQNTPGDKYCRNCGAFLPDTAAAHTVERLSRPAEEVRSFWKKLKWYHWLLIVLAVLSVWDLFERVDRIEDPGQTVLENCDDPERFSAEQMVWLVTPDSDTFVRVGYDRENAMMGVTFRAGGTYYYFEFPEDEWDSFINAASMEQYYEKYIKGQFHGARIG